MLALLISLLASVPSLADERVIQSVDFYGVRTIPEGEVRERLGIFSGDVFGSREEWKAVEAAAIERVARIPGVVDVRLSLIRTGDGSVLYVGIAEKGSPSFQYDPPPQADVRLPDVILADYRDFGIALQAAVRENQLGDDFSQGHSLMEYGPLRAIQERFVQHAELHGEILRRALHTSADARQRQIAAQVFPYARDKRTVVGDLLQAARDVDENTRNNAVRALAPIVHLANENPELEIDVPGTLFVEMLNSVVWTDRNKAMAVLMELTEPRGEILLAELREEALPALVEMARWKHDGHAVMAYLILGRVGGIADDELIPAWTQGEREPVIARVMAAIKDPGGCGPRR